MHARAPLQFALLTALAAGPVLAQRHAREGAQVLDDRDAMEDSSLWIYNDVAAGFEKARETGKPLLVAFR